MTDTQTAETPSITPTLPPNAIHHPQCGSWWTGLGRAHCASCHRTFSCDSAAGRHRVGKFGVDRRCADPTTVGLVPVDKPYGVMWQNPGPDNVATGTPAQWNRI